MIVTAHQPNFLPWLGFFDKWTRADVLVLLDDVQFPRTGAGVWTNRVRLLVEGKARWATVPVSRAGRGIQLIRDVRIDDTQQWRRKLLRTIELNYSGAPMFEEAMPFVRSLIESEAEFLADYNEQNLRRLGGAIGLDEAKLVHSSDLGVEAVGTELLIGLTRAAGGTVYLSGDGATGYQDDGRFARAGLELRFQQYQHPVYPQLSPEPVPGLSIVDALLNCGFEGTRALLA